MLAFTGQTPTPVNTVWPSWIMKVLPCHRPPPRPVGASPQALVRRPAHASGLAPWSWGSSTSKEMCIQADLDTTGAFSTHEQKRLGETCVSYASPSLDQHFFSFYFRHEWVMSTCEHQGRDTVLQTGLKLNWSRRSASSCFNRVWKVTKKCLCKASIVAQPLGHAASTLVQPISMMMISVTRALSCVFWAAFSWLS